MRKEGLGMWLAKVWVGRSLFCTWNKQLLIHFTPGGEVSMMIVNESVI